MFYRVRQGDESVNKWSCRLEDIIGKAIEKGMIQHKDAKAAAISGPINNSSEFEEVKGLIQKLTTRFDRMETNYRGRGIHYNNYRGENRYNRRQQKWQD